MPRGFSREGGSLAGRLYVAPADGIGGPAAQAALLSGNAWRLAGRDDLAFSSVLAWLRDGVEVIEAESSFRDALAWSARESDAVAEHVGRSLSLAAATRPNWAGLSFDRPRLMGIVNVTPDSFSDGGRFFGTEAAVRQGIALVEAGADIIDVGGESTRPGSDEVDPDEEVRRTEPVVRELASRGVRVSIDTRHAKVMAAAIAAGAVIVNDITALTGDDDSLAVVAGSKAAVCLMHMQGEPRSMQAAPVYGFAPLDVYDYLAHSIEAAVAAGIEMERLCIDPGIGFGKSVAHNVEVLQRLGLYQTLGVPVLLGVSRKSMIARLSRGEPADQRLPGSLAIALAGLNAGVQILRVHDVAETAQAMAIWTALRG